MRTSFRIEEVTPFFFTQFGIGQDFAYRGQLRIGGEILAQKAGKIHVKRQTLLSLKVAGSRFQVVFDPALQVGER